MTAKVLVRGGTEATRGRGWLDPGVRNAPRTREPGDSRIASDGRLSSSSRTADYRWIWRAFGATVGGAGLDGPHSEGDTMAIRPDPYPVDLSVDYPDAPRNRLTALFRLVLAVPILVILSALTDRSFVSLGGGDSADTIRFTVDAGGILFLPTLLMLVFRHKYPGWWFDWNLNLLGFENRVFAYLFLLRDEYPATDIEQSVHLVLPDPGGGGSLNRWMPLVKWLLVIPHLIVLFILTLVAVVLTVIAWVAIVITGRHPRGIYEFVVGFLRWWLRVDAYAFVLVTDRYPPFRLAP